MGNALFVSMWSFSTYAGNKKIVLAILGKRLTNRSHTYPSATERRHVWDHVSSAAAICTAAGAGSIASPLKATNSELFRQLKKLATEKGRQLSLTSLASARNASANTVQATRS